MVGFWPLGFAQIYRLLFSTSLDLFKIMFLGKFPLIDSILRNSNKEILALAFSKSSTKLYSTSGITFSFGVAFLPKLGVDVDFGLSCDVKPLLLVL